MIISTDRSVVEIRNTCVDLISFLVVLELESKKQKKIKNI